VVMWHVQGIVVGGARRLGRGGWCTTIGRSQGGDVARTRDHCGRCTAIGTWRVMYGVWEVAGW